ncbi:MAG: DsbA family protein, partial [Gammaproteobacteria bacterium]|nr:DsbA family protein [Gammaproteobacteria bacterium]
AMPEELQHTISNTWKNIQQEIPGIEFNYNFWTQCQPRRSTYPACRAIIACRMQCPQSESDMLLAIQQAYYLQAKNPSDLDVLIELADKIGLNTEQFSNDIVSDGCQNALMDEIEFCRNIYVHSFPSLVLKQAESHALISVDYNDCASILNQIHQQITQHQKNIK